MHNGRDLLTSIKLSDSPANEIEAGAVVVGVYKTDDGPTLAEGAQVVDTALGGTLAASLKTLGASGKEAELTKIAAAGLGAPLVIAVGLGTSPASEETLRRSAGAAVRSLAGTETVALALPAASVEQLRNVLDGALLSAYSFTRYRGAENGNHKAPV